MCCNLAFLKISTATFLPEEPEIPQEKGMTGIALLNSAHGHESPDLIALGNDVEFPSPSPRPFLSSGQHIIKASHTSRTITPPGSSEQPDDQKNGFPYSLTVDRATWSGWAELENDPVCLNATMVLIMSLTTLR